MMARQAAPLTLPDRQAHLWVARPERFTDPAELARYRAILTDDERAKTDRFRFARDRHTCLIARALVRTTLSRYGDVPPGRWRFCTNDHGRPYVSTPASPVRFNLSHTTALIVCLVSRDREVGVDVEHLGARQPLGRPGRPLLRAARSRRAAASDAGRPAGPASSSTGR